MPQQSQLVAADEVVVVAVACDPRQPAERLGPANKPQSVSCGATMPPIRQGSDIGQLINKQQKTRSGMYFQRCAKEALPYLHVLLVLKLKPQQVEFVHLRHQERIAAVIEDAAVEGLRPEKNPFFLQAHGARHSLVVEQTFRHNFLFEVTLIQTIL